MSNNGKSEKLDSLIGGLFTDGPYGCQQCGAEMDLPGVCDACHAKAERKRVIAKCEDALETLPRMLSWADFENEELLRSRVTCPPDDDPIIWAKKFLVLLVNGGIHNIVLRGPTGVGKTVLACAMARLVPHVDPEVGQRMIFASCVDTSFCRREAKWGEGRGKTLERARSCSLLIFDDLMQEQANNADVAIEIIHARYDARLPTIFTTWATPEEITERYGGGTSRRVLGLAAEFTWPDDSEETDEQD